MCGGGGGGGVLEACGTVCVHCVSGSACLLGVLCGSCKMCAIR